MKTALLALALLIAATAHAQQRPHPRFCTSSDKSGECIWQRYRAKVEADAQQQRQLLEKREAANRAEREEKERLRMIKDKDCNPRVRNCD